MRIREGRKGGSPRGKEGTNRVVGAGGGESLTRITTIDEKERETEGATAVAIRIIYTDGRIHRVSYSSSVSRDHSE